MQHPDGSGRKTERVPQMGVQDAQRGMSREA